MILKTKYEIGQKLWEIQRAGNYEGKCKHCGEDIHTKLTWAVVAVSHKIANILYLGEGYIIYQGWGWEINESDIDETYFTTREAAIAECERRNAELEGVGNE